MAMYLARTLGGYKLREIGQALGIDKYPTVSSGCSIIKNRIKTDRRLARKASHIQKTLLNHHPETDPFRPLTKPSVVNVTQLQTNERAYLREKIGTLPQRVFREVWEGVQLVLKVY